MKEFEVSIRVRNNLLKQRRVELGLSQAGLCRATGMRPSEYSALETMKVSPLNAFGEWRPIAITLASFYGLPLENLWPKTVRALRSAQLTQRVTSAELFDLVGSRALPADEAMSFCETKALLASAVEKLRPRVRAVLSERYGLHGSEPRTYADVASAFGISVERARQITEEGLRELRRAPGLTG